MDRGKDVRIDLHNHTTGSDGQLDLVALCALKKDLVDVLCVTDHFPTYPESFHSSLEKAREYNHARKGVTPLCIVGMEYMLSSGVEVLLFGNSGIESVIDEKPATPEELGRIREKHGDMALIICHPVHDDSRGDAALLSIADGMEVTSMGVMLEEHEAELRAIADQYELNLFASADFHSTMFSRMTYSIIRSALIEHESDLVGCLKAPLEVEFMFGDLWRRHIR